MRILHVIHRFLPDAPVGGTTTYLHDLAREQARVHEVRVFCGGPPDSGAPGVQELEVDGIRLLKMHHRLQHWRWCTNNPDVDNAFRRVLATTQPDVVHFHSLALLSNALPRICRDARIRTVFTLHDQWFACLRIFPWHRHHGHDEFCARRGPLRCSKCLVHDLASEKRTGLSALATVARASVHAAYQRPVAMRNAFDLLDQFVAPSQWMRHYLAQNGFPAHRIAYCGYGLDTKPYVSLPSTCEVGRLRVGYFGGQHHAKGWCTLIDAARSLPAHFQVDLYGFPSIPGESAGAPRVSWQGVVSGAEKLEAFSRLDVIVVPSLFADNSPLTIHEARAATIPVVGSRIGGIPELIEDGKTGFLFTPGCHEELRRKLLWFAEHPAESRRMRSGIQPIKTIECHAMELERYYDGSSQPIDV